jgi:SAM-dependent methyltransferase
VTACLQTRRRWSLVPSSAERGGVDVTARLAFVQDSTARWNHNTLYHRVILDAVPAGCRRALDVGCGEGTLTRELRQLVPEVVGIDIDQASIAAAQAHPGARDIRYEADALTCGFAPASFDLVTAVASLHHMDAEPALRRLGDLLPPGGILVVIGFAHSSLRDLPIDIAAIMPNRLRRPRSPYWQHPSPTAWAPHSYASMRRIAARVLPGARFQRRLYWRYSLVWVKPQAAQSQFRTLREPRGKGDDSLPSAKTRDGPSDSGFRAAIPDGTPCECGSGCAVGAASVSQTNVIRTRCSARSKSDRGDRGPRSGGRARRAASQRGCLFEAIIAPEQRVAHTDAWHAKHT